MEQKKSSVKNISHSSSNKQKQKRTHNIFFGPFRIVIIDDHGKYCPTVWMSICSGLTQFMLGATNIMALGYTIKSNDIHVALCTAGWHFFSAEAILSFNYVNGWSAPMKARHRKLAHVVLQLCGLICVISGFMLITVDRGVSFTPHGLTGVMGFAMTVLTILLGPTALMSQGQAWKVFHVSFAVPAFILSSICVCLGFNKSSFENWTGFALMIVLLVFVSFYTLFIVSLTFIKCIARIRYI